MTESHDSHQDDSFADTEAYKKAAGNEIALRYILKECFSLLTLEQQEKLARKVKIDAQQAEKLPNGKILGDALLSIINKLVSST